MKITKYIFLICFIALTGISLSAQNLDKLSKPIMEEAMKLYKSEMASWYGTDIFMSEYTDKERIGGYISYSKDNENICVFYSKDEIPVVIATIRFDDDFNIEDAERIFKDRNFTEEEVSLYRLRLKANEIISNDSDFFKRYNDTAFNLIPLIDKKINKVYVLTGPKINGYMILGNDYLMNFDKDDELISKKSLHQNILIYELESDQAIISSMHNHSKETGDLITVTDICTLMLYGKFTEMESHIVIAEKYVSIWDMKKNSLTIMKRKAYDKIRNFNPEKSD